MARVKLGGLPARRWSNTYPVICGVSSQWGSGSFACCRGGGARGHKRSTALWDAS